MDGNLAYSQVWQPKLMGVQFLAISEVAFLGGERGPKGAGVWD